MQRYDFFSHRQKKCIHSQQLAEWNTYGGQLWKDWTTVGVDLDPLHARTIYIQLTTYELHSFSHFTKFTLFMCFGKKEQRHLVSARLLSGNSVALSLFPICQSTQSR